MQDEYLKHGGMVSRASALLDPERQAQHPYYQATLDAREQAADLQKIGYSCVIMKPEWAEMSEIMGTEAARAIAGEVTAKEACESMQV